MLAFVLVWVAAAAVERPNFLILFVDDLGYADIEPFGRLNVSTPNFNRIAAEGVKFTQWISAAPICTPSRAGLQTGRYPHRMGLTDNLFRVMVTPSQPGGLPYEEMTLAENVKQSGYATGMSGKWHLGVSNHTHLYSHLPTSRGYDTWFGHPLSNSGHCTEAKPPPLSNFERETVCLLMDGSEVVQQPILMDSGNITGKLVQHGIDFIERTVLGSRDASGKYTPFLFVMSFLHVHTALFSSPKFTNVSNGGRFGDNVEECDWGAGLLLDTLDRLGVANDTLVFMASDNGPYAEDGWDNCGRTGGLKGSKGQTYEGGIRVPAMARWPGKIPLNTQTDVLVSTLDIFPTVAALSGSPLPPHVIDGKDLTPVLLDPLHAPSQHKYLFHYCGTNITAARHGNIKVHFATANWTTTYEPSPACINCCPDTLTRTLIGVGLCNCEKLIFHNPPLMYDVGNDRNETTPLTPTNFPDYDREVALIMKAVAEHKATIGHPKSQLIPLINPKHQPCCDHEGQWPLANCSCNKLGP